MSARVSGIGSVPNGTLTDVGLSIMQLGMITGLHAAISPSFFTFACFAKKPAECRIAKRTLWISLLATTVTNVGILFAFKRWAPAITGQIVGTGLFVGGMLAVGSDEEAPTEPSMESQVPTEETKAPPTESEVPSGNVAGTKKIGDRTFRKSAHEESVKTTGTSRSVMPGESPYDSAELGPVHESYHIGQPDVMVVS